MARKVKYRELDTKAVRLVEAKGQAVLVSGRARRSPRIPAAERRQGWDLVRSPLHRHPAISG